jgi:glucokinase
MSEHAIGIDLGGTNLRAARVAIDGHLVQIVEQRRVAVGEDRAPERVCDKVVKLCDELSAGDPLPVGIGAAGMMDGTDGVLANAPNLGWRDVSFGSMVTAQLGRRVWVENDLSAITWGEHRFGAARGFEHVVCVFVGTGVGGGGVIEGQLLRGGNNVTMEVGHIKVVLEEGRLCGCGQRGCLEAYVGGRSLEQLARSLPGRAYSSRQFNELGVSKEQLHSGHLDQMARGGEAHARIVIERAGRF